MRELLTALTFITSTWIFAQILALISFSPPFSQTALLRIPLIQLITYESLFYHALAVSFVAVLVYVSIDILNLTGRAADYAIINATIGYVCASAGAWTIIMLRWNPIAHAVLYFGLSLSFLAGASLLLAISRYNVRAESIYAMKKERAIKIGIWLAIFFVLSTSLIGFYASTGSSQWGALEELERFRIIVAAHRHAIVTVVAAAVVFLASKHFNIQSFKGTRGLFGDIGLYMVALGIPAVSISTYATIPLGVAAHNVITPSGAIILQGSLFIMYAVMADIALENSHAHPIKNLFKDPASFGLLFTFFWVNIAVTLPGIYVALHLDKFVGLKNEIPFILGHEHALATLTAVALFLLALLRINNIGHSIKIVGSLMTAGYILLTGATVFYIFLDPEPHSSFAMPYIQLGIFLMLIGFLTGLIMMFYQLIQSRRW
ncbi:MAG: hypothetical protein QXW32_07330 [Nitrososphaerales archaeon]